MPGFDFAAFDSLAHALHGVDGRRTVGSRDQRYLCEPAGPSERLTLVSPLPEATSPGLHKQAVRNGQVFVLTSGERPSLRTHGAPRWAAVSVPLPRLQRGAQARGLAEVWPHGAATMHQTSLPLTRALGWLVEQLAARPEGAAREALEARFLDTVFEVLWEHHAAQPAARGRPRMSRDQIIGQALECMESAPMGHEATVETLCQYARVSERTLREAFIEWCGMGPARYMRLLQLHRLHRTLVLARSRHESVQHVMARLFSGDPAHLHRDYKALFGETPGQTLGLRG